MFIFDKKDEPEELDTLITRVLTELEQYGPDSPEYPALLSYLERLYTLNASTDVPRIDRNTMLNGAVHILGIFVIVAYEQKHVFASKALGLIKTVQRT